ncbi:sigma-54 interaction domain-containing protein [Fuerstiella marisgermanici]|uniref:Transcriptional regulatory protein ZraR n=1 Tax=Fuerstiella marisgermanici TaxID=1891926 RepID=A0A1P8WBT9_9PLAN|nr:sigma-54-dependent Fis family transcriptional regulator [Fuerstiella marisgermanici]APZ91473.1 Transcriptional regulatory protein ZraR [Fuerstiella marisgermanici]
MAGTQWIRPEESLASASSLNCGTLIQLCGRQMAHALQSESVAEFLSSEAPELATELAVQWLAVVKRIPGPTWETVGAHGRHSLPKLPTQFWDESQERESAGQIELDGGWTAFAVPLDRNTTTRGRSVGDLMVGLTRNPDDQLLPSAVLASRSLSIGLELAAQKRESRQHVDRLKSTLDIASRLSAAEETAPLLDLIAKEATRLLDCDRSSIFLWDKERKEVEARPALGVKNGALRLPAGEGIVGETLRTGQAIVVDEAYEDPRFNQEVDQRSGYRTRNLICVPLRDADGDVVGAFEGINRNDRQPFTEDDVECLQQLGTQAAVAVRNLRERSLLNRSRNQLAEQVTSQVEIVGTSASISALRDTVRRLASTDLPVLVLGESGTGKEVVANAIHFDGARANSPFVAVNCAAIAESLLESELFGHEQGAFTDARDTRQGKFELADGGTLFLDEIGDMSLGGQAKLLRVLEQKVITKVGGSDSIPVNVRIVAATNSNLTEAVREKRFREDLYYRLSVVTLDLPPLRDRPEDILLLAEHFLARFAAQARRPSMQFTADARRRLQAHAWPGNVRELRNLMERVAFLAANDRIDADDLAFILSPEEEGSQQLSLDLGLDTATREFQKDFIRRSIKQVNNNMTDAAKLLGLHRSNLYRKMKQLEMSEVTD